MSRRRFLRTSGGAVVGGSLLYGPSQSTGAQSGEAWPQFGYDDANTGHAPTNTGPVADIEEQWSFEMRDTVSSSPAVVDGTVYVGSHDNHMYALDATDGTEQWTYETSGVVDSSPAVVDGTVYVGSRDTSVYALDADDGAEQWIYETGGRAQSSPVMVDGTIYIGSWDGNVYALDADDGTEQWTYMTGNKLLSPAVVDGTVFVGSWDNLGESLGGTVYALDAADGTEQWAYETDEVLQSAPAVADGTIYIGSWDTSVYALNAADGTEQWRYQAGGVLNSSPAVADGTVYVRSIDGNVYALDADDGTTQWSFATDGGVPAVVDGTVYIGRYALDAADGTEQWSYQKGGELELSPAVANGTVYIGSDDGSVYALTDQTPTPTPSPEPASMSEPTPEPTSEPTSTESPVSGQGSSQGAREVVPVALGLLGLGGAGAWWLARSGGDSNDAESPDDGTSSGAGGTSSGAIPATPPEEPSTTSDSGSPATASSPDQPITPADPRIPAEIPRAPEISVEYEALTDEELIGSGGTADVTNATLPTPDGDVTLAIKRPRMAGTLHTETVERLLAEAETWASLDDHDHIVGVIDYGGEPLPWIAMEYMDGGHLGDRAGALDTQQALWTALAVTKGVRHAHRRGVAHLDLKPENVLFRSVEDAWDVPKVADWGLSKHLLDHSKSIEGLSPAYAAPEQFADEYSPVDDITDVYQLGAVFYELFTGRPPFKGDPARVMQQVLREPPAPPSEVAEVPEAVDEILLTALAKEKADRYESVLYFRDALQELYDDW